MSDGDAALPARAASRPGLSRSLLGHALYVALACAAVYVAATVTTDGYVANILMQAATYAVAVFGLSVVLGLCGQINLAQAAFFAFGAYAVGAWHGGLQSVVLALPAHRHARARRIAGGLLGVSTLAAGRPLSRDGDDLVPADPHRRADQRDRLHARAGRRALDQTA